MTGDTTSAIETVIVPRTRDLGDGFQVRRALPAARRRMVGPFIFFDQMGPVVLTDAQGLDVRPHPHIGLATVTYLFQGELLHRDSLGIVQRIRPGEVNWMTAGRGIVHSERTPKELRKQGERLFGIQAWVALPKAHEETEPSFSHVGHDELPVIEGEGLHARVIAGACFGARTKVATLSEMFYADVIMQTDARLALPAEHEERAFYVTEGAVDVDGERHGAGELVIVRPRADPVVNAAGPARLLLLGGEPMDGPRHIWWNFVSSSEARIAQAKADWKAGAFATVPDETEFIPLPEEPPPDVRYP
jgi:redox-sensitive bicupin YhaK (pirin superfamily)